MPKLTLMPSGVKAFVPTNHKRKPGKRQGCNGWSLSSARRNDLFLRSVEYSQLDGVAISLTLTLRTRPKNHDEWERMRRAFVERLRRMGLIRLHWITEWQPRVGQPEGPAPHLHAVAFFDKDALIADCHKRGRCTNETIVDHWVTVAAECSPCYTRQRAVNVTNIKGWFNYLAKHGARGVFHYQRASGQLPEGWEKTGRMWGKSGEWATSEDELQLSSPAFYALRRVVDRWLIALAEKDLRRASLPHKKQAAQKRLDFLRDPHKRLRSDLRDYPQHERLRRLRSIGAVSGISEWCDPGQVIRWLHSCCEPVENVDQETGEVTTVWELKPPPLSHSKHLRLQLPCY